MREWEREENEQVTRWKTLSIASICRRDFDSLSSISGLAMSMYQNFSKWFQTNFGDQKKVRGFLQVWLQVGKLYKLSIPIPFSVPSVIINLWWNHNTNPDKQSFFALFVSFPLDSLPINSFIMGTERNEIMPHWPTHSQRTLHP